ncbi:craniofacial development protein 2-like [Schistocerca americana]|uniref:craniofacial development protein 2-like n=1 Tax=Schistocerca americana TaxID=7009 RepID=UPI001F4FD3CA|nr:craniofacial development protein 2-like [Schistocerca americana]
MTLRFTANSGRLTLISVYVPTLTSAADAKDRFYEQLGYVVQGLHSGDRRCILGDFNARVGNDFATWPDCLGKHGVGKMNENGLRLLEFCPKYQLCVTNTHFKSKLNHKLSCMHPRSKHWHQLDLIVTKRKDHRYFLHTRSYLSADCGTDHALVATKARFVSKCLTLPEHLAKQKLIFAKQETLL